jgi:multidrug efflux system outer membrane protein
VRLYTLQFQYGQTSQMTVSQTQSQYETAAVQIPQIESQIAQTENALSVLLGRNPGPIPRGKSVYDLALPPVPAGVPSSLLERRPDLMQSEQTLIAANAQIGAARALYFPTISLTGAFGGASAALSNLFSGPARAVELHRSGRRADLHVRRGERPGREAEAAQQSALYNYRYSIQNAFADVDNALVANAKLQDQLAAQERLVAALKDYARLAQLQYDGGYTSYTTVLQAEQSLFPAELTLASVRASVFASAANTYKAMGGGWVRHGRPPDDGGATVPPTSASRNSPSSDPARPSTLRPGACGMPGLMTQAPRALPASRGLLRQVGRREVARKVRQDRRQPAFQAFAKASGVAAATGTRCRYSRDQITFGASAFAGDR